METREAQSRVSSLGGNREHLQGGFSSSLSSSRSFPALSSLSSSPAAGCARSALKRQESDREFLSGGAETLFFSLPLASSSDPSCDLDIAEFNPEGSAPSGGSLDASSSASSANASLFTSILSFPSGLLSAVSPHWYGRPSLAPAPPGGPAAGGAAGEALRAAAASSLSASPPAAREGRDGGSAEVKVSAAAQPPQPFFVLNAPSLPFFSSPSPVPQSRSGEGGRSPASSAGGAQAAAASGAVPRETSGAPALSSSQRLAGGDNASSSSWEVEEKDSLGEEITANEEASECIVFPHAPATPAPEHLLPTPTPAGTASAGPEGGPGPGGLPVCEPVAPPSSSAPLPLSHLSSSPRMLAAEAATAQPDEGDCQESRGLSCASPCPFTFSPSLRLSGRCGRCSSAGAQWGRKETGDAIDVSCVDTSLCLSCALTFLTSLSIEERAVGANAETVYGPRDPLQGVAAPGGPAAATPTAVGPGAGTLGLAAPLQAVPGGGPAAPAAPAGSPLRSSLPRHVVCLSGPETQLLLEEACGGRRERQLWGGAQRGGGRGDAARAIENFLFLLRALEVSAPSERSEEQKQFLRLLRDGQASLSSFRMEPRMEGKHADAGALSESHDEAMALHELLPPSSALSPALSGYKQQAEDAGERWRFIVGYEDACVLCFSQVADKRVPPGATTALQALGLEGARGVAAKDGAAGECRAGNSRMRETALVAMLHRVFPFLFPGAAARDRERRRRLDEGRSARDGSEALASEALASKALRDGESLGADVRVLGRMPPRGAEAGERAVGALAARSEAAGRKSRRVFFRRAAGGGAGAARREDEAAGRAGRAGRGAEGGLSADPGEGGMRRFRGPFAANGASGANEKSARRARRLLGAGGAAGGLRKAMGRGAGAAKKRKRRGVSYAQFLFPSHIMYDPYALDNMRFQQGRHQTVMRMAGSSVSVIPYFPPQQLKEELNQQFHKMHPSVHPSMTLSKLRSLKQDMFSLIEQEEQLDVSTVASAWVYFERLVQMGAVDKSMRKLYAGACLILAFKFNQNGEPNVVQRLCGLLTHGDRQRGLASQSLSQAEFTVFGLLGFSLQLSIEHVLPHILHYLESKDTTFEEVYGSPETAFFSA
ncbi:hypothetical protein BESB_020070 [Besnoitia besnoiti]|uniref:Cyclin N-terminal domain-containing protein n=1 Tax=Besnoitia besnoiti TaxID=94643 RepID=A0A2A9M822_BESBE|nr:hypothetical protein BESB_020070 [Besnoitia besnoiti]PFH32066.1 hypothetical protein BESB_020070 [Besnoitia besnoiti]